MSPREVVERWVERFNSADADGLADLYHVDAVNHQVTQEPSQRGAIRSQVEAPDRHPAGHWPTFGTAGAERADFGTQYDPLCT
jgi:hypothetical protein